MRGLKREINERGHAGSKMEGALEELQRELRHNTETLVTIRAEVNALWRFVEGSSQRLTDIKRG